jgi:hypothetical protein
MPILDISDGKGKLIPAAALAMFGAMAHPSDEDARDAFMMSAFFGTGWAEMLGLERLPVPAFVARTLSQAAASDVTIKKTFGSPAGSMAGLVLALALSAEKSLPGRGSARLAQFIAAKVLAKRNAEPDRKRRVKAKDLKGFPASDTAIENAWREFKSAAHLWAAMNDWQASDHGPEMSPRRPEGLLRFLARAEFYRREAEALRPHPGKPLYADGELWRAPADIALPQASVEIAPLSGQMLSEAEKYEAK